MADIRPLSQVRNIFYICFIAVRWILMLSPALRKTLYIIAFVYSKIIWQKQNIEKQTQIAVGKSKPIHMYFSFA